MKNIPKIKVKINNTNSQNKRKKIRQEYNPKIKEKIIKEFLIKGIYY